MLFGVGCGAFPCAALYFKTPHPGHLVLPMLRIPLVFKTREEKRSLLKSFGSVQAPPRQHESGRANVLWDNQVCGAGPEEGEEGGSQHRQQPL